MNALTPTEPPVTIQNHLLICGWKQDMGLIVSEILQADPQWNERGLVILANVRPEDVEEVKSDPALSGVYFILDEAFHEPALKQASIQSAAKVIVLADWSDKTMSSTETDAKTVMTMMAIEKLAPHVYKIAEILDPDYAVYLKMAHVDELIFPRDYSRLLLAVTAFSAGVSHVVYDLLTVDTPCTLTTTPVPDHLIGKPFSDLFRHFDERPEPRSICIGLLENTGNLHALRRRAKSEAQKSTEIRTVLSNLKLVKEIQSNLPKLNPGDDYLVQPYSMAVLLATPNHG